MSMKPGKNKMMSSSPTLKEFFFAGTADRAPQTLYAENIEEAKKIYNGVASEDVNNSKE